MTNDDPRIYTDAEFSVILRKAAELAKSSPPERNSSTRLTLTEIKAAAAEAGIDPGLVERAARLLSADAAQSTYERLVGGAARQSFEMRIPVTLDTTQATRFLASVQMVAGQPGSGHSSAAGMVWHGRNEMEMLSITARPVEAGTAVSINVDRTGIFAFVHVAGLIGSVVVAAGGIALGDQVAPVVGLAASVGGIAGIVALGRAYWKSSTRQIHKQINELMDALSTATGQRPGSHAHGEPASNEDQQG